MKDFTNKKALITGGASGIGKLMGKMLLQKGLHTLVIWDINNTLLQSTVEEFTALGYKVLPYCIDVMNTQSMIDGAEQVKKDIGIIDLLINNAGIIVGKYFTDHTHEDIDRSMIINGSAGMHLCKLFLPGMVQQKNGHIVNIASAAGI
ncbi:MAG: SDR family NAD(P)-dependent oxidoreductase [Sphingobacteriales bacterium]|nr:SDR family NAD(P)-dependent oxidoreductase [Sphingobacteriales bacterium]